MVRTQIVLESEVQRQARRKASELGISLAEYVRRLVARDLGGASCVAEPSAVYDVGRSRGADVARDKDTMIGEAVASGRSPRRRKP